MKDKDIKNIFKIWKISHRVLDSIYLPKNIEAKYTSFDIRCCNIIDTKSRYNARKSELSFTNLSGKYQECKRCKDLYIQEIKRLQKYYLKHKKILDNSRNILTVININYL